MSHITVIQVRGSASPGFIATLISSLRPELSPVSLKAVGFETERLFMRARAEMAVRGICTLTPRDCAGCEWELRGPQSVLARVRISDAPEVGSIAISVPGDPTVESGLQRLLRNAYDPLERDSTGSFKVSPLYAEYVREIIFDCYDVKSCCDAQAACVAPVAETAKVGFAAKLCLFMIIFFIPFVCLVWKIFKDVLI